MNIHLPELRKRKEDIPLLVDYLLQGINQRLGCHVTGLDDSIIQVMEEYNWPGNVRELQNTLEKIVALTTEGVACHNDILPVLQDLYYRQQKYETRRKGANRTIEEVERDTIIEALAEENGNKTRAARRLGMDRSTLLRKIERYQIKGW